jgi:ABC-type glycerol-3-phosphate transport system substrate-binding protein
MHQETGEKMRRKMSVFCLILIFLSLFACSHGNRGVKYTDGPSCSDKIILTLGGFSAPSYAAGYDDWFMRLEMMVREYNISNEEIEIQIINYGSIDDLESVQKVSTAILSGNMPDLLLTDGLPYEQYATKGFLADLNQFLSNDESGEGLGYEDFFYGPLQSMEDGEKLYRISPFFKIISYYGLKSVIGDSEGLAISLLLDRWNDFNSQDSIFSNYFCTSEGALRLFLSGQHGEQYIDEDQKTCRFDNQDFIELLEMCAILPVQPMETSLQKQYAHNLHPCALVRENQAMLAEVNLGGVISMLELKTYMAGQEITFIGIPGTVPAQAMAMPVLPIAISSDSEYKEEAWSFLSALLSWDAQYVEAGFIPLKIDLLDTVIDRTYSELWDFAEQGDASVMERLSMKLPLDYDRFGTDRINSAPFLKEDYETMINLINSATIPFKGSYYHPYQINTEMEIILEEAQEYFYGHITAQEAAEKIHMRVTRYLSEQN